MSERETISFNMVSNAESEAIKIIEMIKISA